MTIKAKSENITDRQVFQIMYGGNLPRMKDNIGRTLDIVGYVRYEDTDSDGKSRDLLAIITGDGDIIATNSGTMIRTFDAMIEQFSMPINDVQIYSTESKKTGLEYLNFQLV